MTNSLEANIRNGLRRAEDNVSVTVDALNETVEKLMKIRKMRKNKPSAEVIAELEVRVETQKVTAERALAQLKKLMAQAADLFIDPIEAIAA